MVAKPVLLSADAGMAGARRMKEHAMKIQYASDRRRYRTHIFVRWPVTI